MTKPEEKPVPVELLLLLLPLVFILCHKKTWCHSRRETRCRKKAISWSDRITNSTVLNTQTPTFTLH